MQNMCAGPILSEIHLPKRNPDLGRKDNLGRYEQRSERKEDKDDKGQELPKTNVGKILRRALRDEKQPEHTA